MVTNVVTPIGANLGEVLEAVGGKPFTPEAAPAQRNDTQQTKYTGNYRIIGIEMQPEAYNPEAGEKPGVTIDALYPAIGRIIVGPEARQAGRMRFEQFVQQIGVHTLFVNNFSIISDRDRQNNRVRRIGRGSIVAEPSGCFVCPSCKRVYANLSQQDLLTLQKQRGGARPHCFNPDCGYKPAMFWRPDSPSMGAGDPRARALFKAYSAAASNPIEEDTSIIPEAFAVYPKNKAPTDEVPWTVPNGRLTQYLTERLASVGKVIRSVRTALASQSPEIAAIRMTVPVEWTTQPMTFSEHTDETTGEVIRKPVVPDWVQEVSEDEIMGSGWRPVMALGWLSPEVLGGSLSKQRGYTVRLRYGYDPSAARV